MSGAEMMTIVGIVGSIRRSTLEGLDELEAGEPLPPGFARADLEIHYRLLGLDDVRTIPVSPWNHLRPDLLLADPTRGDQDFRDRRFLVVDEASMLDTARTVLATAESRGVELVLPTDVVVADAIDDPTSISVVASRPASEALRIACASGLIFFFAIAG